MSQGQIKYSDPETPQETFLEEQGVEVEDENDEGPMDHDAIQTEAARIINEAVSYQESDLAPAREQASNYYFGRPFGDEEDGRSQVISTDVKNKVDGMMPSIMRVFFGPTQIVEFEAHNETTMNMARQATDYVNYIIVQDNNGVIELHNAFKDALVRRMGIIKWWWDDTTDVEYHSFSGLSEEQIYALEMDPQVSYIITGKYPYTDVRALTQFTLAQKQYEDFVNETGQLPDVPPPAPPEAVDHYDVEVTYRNADGKAKFAAVPPEEFIFSGDARNIEEAIMVGHRKEVTRSDLEVMGVPEEILTNIGGTTTTTQFRGSSTELASNTERLNRQPSGHIPQREAKGANVLIPLYEIYIYMDVDGDGVTEHRKMTLAGTAPKLIWNEPAPERPFALFECDPEPHAMTGMSVADRVMDIQLSKSKMLRGAHDSLSFSLHPRTVAVEGEANIADLMNTEIGAVIRERQPGMVRELTHTFNGQAALPFLQYADEMAENATGQSKAAAGLDPDALQSSTQAAVAATVAGGHQRLELYARMLAETGMKRLMRGLLRLVVANQSKSRTVRLRNEYVEVDPRLWDSTMDVTINVAVGYTVDEDRLQSLALLLTEQKNIITTMGPQNELVSLGQLSQTLAQMTEIAGFRDTTRYFNKLPPDYRPQPAPPQPSAEEVYANAQAEKVKLEHQASMAELQGKMEAEKMKDERERERTEGELFLKSKDIELKYAVKVDETIIKAAEATAKAEAAKRKGSKD